MRWYNSNGEEISPIQSKGASGGLTLPTSQPNLAPSSGGVSSAPSSGGGFNLDSLTQILTTGAKVAGTVQQQRQQSGAAADRKARIEACGRKGLGYLFSRKKKAEYERCVQEAMASSSGSKSNVPSTPPPPQSGSNTMLYVGIALAVVVLGGAVYFIKKSK